MIRGRQWLLVAAGLVVVQGLTLRWMGQPWICDCGTVRLWSGDIWSSENSQQIADWYSLSHVVHGVLIWVFLRLVLPRRIGFGARLTIAVAFAATWEIVENTDAVIAHFRAATISLHYHGDSVLNSVFDTLWMALGFLLAARLPWKATVATVLALEVLAAVSVRDNLTLSVLMFVHPIEAVRAWQAGG